MCDLYGGISAVNVNDPCQLPVRFTNFVQGTDHHDNGPGTDRYHQQNAVLHETTRSEKLA